MALVYLARDIQRGRQVALKVLRSELGGLDGAARFHREIRLVADLVHPNILPLLDSGETDGRLWYTTPFIEGESLRARLDRESQLPMDDAVRLTREIADALGYAHRRGILHRDIKPDNILLADGHAMVADFGIARAIMGDPGGRLTQSGVSVGTPGYMSPEQSVGERALDARSDVYALGSVCYEMLAGEPPFTGPTAQAIIARRLSQPPPSLRTTRPGVPDALDAAIQRALSPAPVDRFASTDEFARALTAVPGGVPSRQWRWPVLALCAVSAIAFVVYRIATRASNPAASMSAATGGIRLAVVPFRLIGNDAADQYLADGISEEVNSTLSNLGGLRVIAQSSVASTATPGRSLRDVGAMLHADALVEGDVQRAGTAIRVRVRLIDPATEETRWSQQFDHTTQDVFTIQSEIASKVAGLLRIQWVERESRSLARPPTRNPAAYDYYLRGRTQEERADPTPAGLDSAIDQLTRAIQLDSNFAAAWARRAASIASAVFLYGTDTVRLGIADADIRRAMALDSTLAVAWDARSAVAWSASRGWNFPQALADVRRALALQPSFVGAHARLAGLLMHYGFSEEARREYDVALSLDPRDRCGDVQRCEGFSRPRIARTLAYEQRFDSALAIYNQLPSGGGKTWEYAVVLSDAGRPADGLALLDSNRGRASTEGRVDPEAARGLIYAALGRPQDAMAQIGKAVASPTSQSHFHHAQFTIASTYARLGKNALALDWLRRTAANGMPNYPLFRNDPNMRGLQGDPPYETLMAGLKQQFERYGQLVRSGAAR